MTNQPAPYKSAAFRYYTHGWHGALPVGTQPGQKIAPPKGYTGNDGQWPTEDQIADWARQHPNVNIAIRLPPDVVGIDVDNYDGKPGGDTMTAATHRHGHLPRTWISTARQDRSGIRWFRLPTPQTLPGKLIHPENPDISGVEVIQFNHRYAIVPPSTHPNGNPYQWVKPDRTPVDNGIIPKPSDLPELPQAWIDHIHKTCSCWGHDWTQYATEPNNPVQAAYDKWAARLTEAYGRHDAALAGVMALVAFEHRGWPGATQALDQLRTAFLTSLGDSRDPTEATKEWERMIEGAQTKAHTTTIPQWENRTHTTPPDPDTFNLRVEEELDRIRVRDTARRRFEIETRPPQPIPQILTLTQRLALPKTDTIWRIEGWQPTTSRVLLAAQYKAGKTTLTGNLGRCLVDGDPWLGVANVNPLTQGHLTILDFEMSPRQIDDWLADQGIINTDRIHVAPLRGQAGAFDILDETVRSEWARHLRGTHYLILDCLRPILDALALDEHREAGRFLTAFDTLCDEAEIPDALVVHHMGHTAERSRGDSRLRDWPDVEWRLVRQDDDPASPRYLSAFGRDVEQEEALLQHDPTTRHITLVGGSRATAEARAALEDILAVLKTTVEPISERAVITQVQNDSEHSRPNIKKGLKLGTRDGLIHVDLGGQGRPNLHHHLTKCESAQGCAGVIRKPPSVSAQVPIGPAHHSHPPKAAKEDPQACAVCDQPGTLIHLRGQHLHATCAPANWNDPTPEDIAP